MATIKRRADRGNRWEVRYRDPEGKQRARLFDRKVEAERFIATTTADMVRGTYIDPGAGQRTFGDYAAQWQACQVHRATPAAQVQSHLKNHILPTFAARPLAAIRPSEVQAWVKSRATVLEPSTVEVVYRYLVAILRAAVADKIIVETPCRGVKLPKVEQGHIVPLATETVEAIAGAMPERYRAMVVLVAGTGLRQGEAFGLTVDRLDFLRRTLRVDQQLSLLAGGGPYLAPPKTEASRRTIPLPNVVVAALAAHLAAFPVGPDGLVFTNDKGEGIRRPLQCGLAQSDRRGRPTARPRLPRAAPLLRQPAHLARRVGQGRPGPPRPRQRQRDAGHLLPPLAGQRRSHPRGD